MKKLFVLFVVFFCIFPVFSQSENPVTLTTFLYAVHDKDSLYLDRYEGAVTQQPKPCIMFMFGGGFSGGRRDYNHYKKYFRYWAQQGYTIVSIDYRLGLRNRTIDRVENDNNAFRLKVLMDAVHMAVEDLFAATNFVLKHAEEWKIDPDFIITTGSSAGAISVLQAEYEICNNCPLATVLPQGFNYAGVVSYAGAIVDLKPLEWKNKPAPILMFHGNIDKSVPYDYAESEFGGFYGSAYIDRQLDELDAPHYFYIAKGKGHEMSEYPMFYNQLEMASFLKRLVFSKEQIAIHNEVQTLPGQVNTSVVYTLEDYFKNNGH
ncbi:alpha/beta hydrolase [Coprobacter sp.]